MVSIGNDIPNSHNVNLDWSKINLFSHGNYFAATYYTSANATQRHILAAIASKLDVTIANPFDEEAGSGRFLTLEELQFMTALGQSALIDNLAVLTGEVSKPLPSTDPGSYWVDPKGNYINSPSNNQRMLFEMWQRAKFKVYVTRFRRQDPKSGLNEATSYGVTAQMIEDYKSAIMTGSVLINQDSNRKYLISVYTGSRGTVHRQPGYGTPAAGVRYTGSRGTGSSEAPDQPARQGAFLTVDNSVDKEVDNNKPRTKIAPVERKRSGAVGGSDSSISKTALLGAISGVLKPTEKAEVSTLIRDTLLAKEFSRETIIKACDWIFQIAGMKRISHDPAKMNLWIEACQSIDAGEVLGKSEGTAAPSVDPLNSFEAALNLEKTQEAQREAEEAQREAVMKEKVARERALLDLDFQTVVSGCFATRKLRPLQKKRLTESMSIRDLMAIAREDAEFKAIFEGVVHECLASESCQTLS